MKISVRELLEWAEDTEKDGDLFVDYGDGTIIKALIDLNTNEPLVESHTLVEAEDLNLIVVDTENNGIPVNDILENLGTWGEERRKHRKSVVRLKLVQ